ncbi:hypothetical protein SCHPADRAFT_679546 [Schizopora paradoxa]|uniref:Uncharacterized protein n=1 Tax=Schizopora paradoxa TaxID=27342 RepID=A0A0H2R4P0_9AGAM|nr:hypothetical protein SCHPADRAFT_679546 [Schizopora paradoxa]
MHRPTTRPIAISVTALDLVLEEIHLRRRVSLREWQESDENRAQRFRAGFPDHEGGILKVLSLVHSSWTPLARRAIGRILVLSDINDKVAKAAVSAPMFGYWTREISMSFSESFSTSDSCEKAAWKSIEVLFSRIPTILTFCINTASEGQYCIDNCVKRLSPMLSRFTRLRTLRLYSDLSSWPDDFNHILHGTEHPSLFRSIEETPNLEQVSLRGFIPCVGKITNEESPNKNSSGHPLSYHMSLATELECSATLKGKAFNLAKLIHCICESPLALLDSHRDVTSLANMVEYVCFKFDAIHQRFFIQAITLSEDSSGDGLPSHPYEDLFRDTEVLDVFSMYNIYKKLAPFQSLRFLRVMISYSDASPGKLVEEMSGFCRLLPPTIEVLFMEFDWEAYNKDLPLETHDDVDNLLATIPFTYCPRLKSLKVAIRLVSDLFYTSKPLKRLIQSCEKAHILLILERFGGIIEVFGISDDYYDREKLDEIFEFSRYLH